MTTPPNFLEYPWRWQMFGGRAVLLAGEARPILTGEHHAPLLTRDLQSEEMRPIDANDDIAKIIAAAPMVRKHSRALIHGLDLGVIRFEIDDASDGSPLDTVISDLREALEKSGGA
ncbi:MAG: hypothetical protein JWP25_3580 [Bradyrhizobium sp.]|nr:hypothetical protein [Bradyrhizobium sp.]